MKSRFAQLQGKIQWENSMRGFMTPFLTIDIANRKRAWSGARQWLVGAVATMAAIALAACGGWRWWQ
jgi:hypothetical protein